MQSIAAGDIMNAISDPVVLGEVEIQITNGFAFLRFTPRIERLFEREVGLARCRAMILQNYIGLVIYHLFLISDYQSVPDVFRLDVFVHFVIMTPIVLAVNVALIRGPTAWVRETLEALSLIILASTIVWVVSASRAPDRDVVLLSIILVVLFSIIMQRIRFWYVLPASLVMLGLYGLCLAGFDPISAERLTMSVSVVLGITVFSLVGAYHLEHEHRMGYLLRLRDGLRHRDLEITSLRDALTEVGNRRALDLALLAATSPGVSDPVRSVATLLVDIDHFKRFNDTNGHQQGDLCLKRVAGLMAASLRAGEGQVYRFGGEEFVILLDGATLPDALLVAERVRAAVEDAGIPAGPSAETVTVSIGVAAGPVGRDTTPQSLVAEADAALYAAKSHGRNRVWPSTDEEVSSVPVDRRLAS